MLKKHKRFKVLFLFSVLLLLSSPVYSASDNNSANNVEIRGVIKTRSVSVRSAPDPESKRVKTLWRGSKVVVVKKEGDWLKIKINNVRTGYVQTQFVDFKSTFKKETKRGSHLLKKARLDIKSLIDRFNVNMNESMYYEKEGIIPYLEFVSCKKAGDTVLVEINYKGKNAKGKNNHIGQDNPFEEMLKVMMEVVFFKMMVVQAEKYEISVNAYIFSEDKKELKPYTVLTYDSNTSSFESLKNDSGKIWEFIESTKPSNTLFTKYP